MGSTGGIEEKRVSMGGLGKWGVGGSRVHRRAWGDQEGRQGVVGDRRIREAGRFHRGVAGLWDGLAGWGWWFARSTEGLGEMGEIFPAPPGPEAIFSP